MGKKTFVDSVAYNMAGDEKLRPQYLKGLVIKNVLSNSRQGMGETINNGYIYGPAIHLRNFFNWADRNYNAIGMPTGRLSGQQSINKEVIGTAIPHAPNESVWVQDAESNYADYFWWAKQWMFENHPDIALEDTWSADINENDIITITFPDDTTTTIIPADFDKTASYIYIYYSLVKENEEGPLITGSIINLGSSTSFPSTSGWSLVSNITDPRSMNLTTTVTELREYSDGRPDEETITPTTSPANYNYNVREYTREIYLGDTGDGKIKKQIEYMNQWRDFTKTTESSSTVNTEDLGGGVTVTITTTTVTEVLLAKNSYQINYREVVSKEFSPTRIFIYRIGSGNTDLDNSVVNIENYGKFFPNIPVRLNNVFLSEDFKPEAYQLAKRAYRRSMSGKFDSLVADLEDNPNIADIDYAFIVFGVSLNVIENSSRKYIYTFFNKLREAQIGGPTVYEDFLQRRQELYENSIDWKEWAGGKKPGNPLFGEPEPEVIKIISPLKTVNRIRINNSGTLNTNYDVRIEWAYMREVFQTGLGKTGAKKDDVWLTKNGHDVYRKPSTIDPTAYDGPPPKPKEVKVEKMRVYWQYEDNAYKYIECLGLVHHNHVYAGKSVTITSHQALDDKDESGFIIPLQNSAFREMRIVDSTQMVTACCFIVFNCYVQKKQKWYQKGIFKVLLFVVVVAITVVTGGAGIGLLGLNATVGGALGFTGLAATIVGAVANALAAVALATIIEVAAKAIFGDFLGGIIASIITFLFTMSISSFHQTGSLAINWGNLMRADVIMKVMDSLGRGYAEYINSNIQDMQKSLDTFLKESEEQLENIKKQYYEEFGYGNAIIDPMMLVDSSKLILESGDTFLTRTLMTGSDIADMSFSMLNDFAELTLTLPNAYA